MTVKEWCIANGVTKAFPESGYSEIVKRCVQANKCSATMARKAVRSIMRGASAGTHTGGGRRTAALVAASSSGAVESFSVKALIERERLDPMLEVWKVLKKWPFEQGLVYDDTMRAKVGLSNSRWSGIRGRQEFENHRALLPGNKMVWGRAADIDAVKQLEGVR